MRLFRFDAHVGASPSRALVFAEDFDDALARWRKVTDEVTPRRITELTDIAMLIGPEEGQEWES